MPWILMLITALLSIFALSLPFSHLFWPEIIEGQVGKQSFVAHMIESWMKGDVDHGFPIRFFAEPWHAGPGPWAEEVPLFHWIAAGIGKLTHMSAVHAGRLTSFLFALLLLYSVRELVKALFPAPSSTLTATTAEPAKKSAIALWLAPGLLLWLPGFQIYAASVIPDLAALSTIAFAYALRLRSPPLQSLGGRHVVGAYLALLCACLLKYFAVFAVLAMFLYDLTEPSVPLRTRLREILPRSLLLATAAVAPTIAYLTFFLTQHIPNPITEYMGANGYGHLAGPFVLQLKFYLRFVTWVFIKNPTLILSICALLGFILSRKTPRATGARVNGWRLLDLHFCAYTLFALIFASSFYVHDYYALPFLIPVLFYASAFLLKLISNENKNQLRAAWVITAGIAVLGFTLSKDATFRLTNYIKASEGVRSGFPAVRDRDSNQMIIFASDFSLPVLPILSQKAGWAFNAEHLEEQKPYLIERLKDSRTQGFVFYARLPEANTLFEQWKAADPKLASMKPRIDLTFESEGKKGSATRLVVLTP